MQLVDMTPNKLSFKVTTDAAGIQVFIPCIDGSSLDELVTIFETENGYTDPAGGYGGLTPQFYQFGVLRSYFFGRGDSPVSSTSNPIAVLACECGEVGCWPLSCRVDSNQKTVEWTDFSQPFRESRDYSGFGPFLFEKRQYENALRQLLTTLDPDA